MIPLKTTFKHLRRSPYQTLSVLILLTLTFFLTSRFVLVSLNTYVTLAYFETRPQVSAFFKDEAKAEDIEAIQNELLQTGAIAQIKFVSKEEAYQIYKEQNKDEPLLVDLVTPDILPASLEISAKDAAKLSQIAGILKEKSQIEEVVFPQDVVEQLKSLVNSVRLEGAIIVGSLILVSLAEILLVIGFRISSRKEEISIMQLVGATPWYIRWPFIFEGAFYGFFGSLVGTSLGFLVFLFFSPLFKSTFFNPFIGLPLNPFTPFVLGIVFSILLFSGLLLGVVGSFLAVFRYLR
jgi:cell division transport system permease protein